MSQAAAMAFDKGGMVLVVSAGGNEGNKPWQNPHPLEMQEMYLQWEPWGGQIALLLRSVRAGSWRMGA